ncbi:MAG: hypothetical protein U0166_13145 [Acidobacteriota bacterium]
MESEDICAVCQEENKLRDVFKCPSCYRRVCDACCYRFGGRPFCSKRCADYFFFGDEDMREVE